MKTFTILLCSLLLNTVSAYAVDDCPPGHVRHPAITSLDDASMLAAYTASFRGIWGRDPTMIPGSGVDDGWYYIRAANHYGVYGDDQCHAGWSGYWEGWITSNHGDLSLVQSPAKFQPTVAPVVTPPVVVPPAPLPTVQTCDISTAVGIAIENLRADLDAHRAEFQVFAAEVRSKWEQLATFVGKYGPIVAGAIFAGRATAK